MLANYSELPVNAALHRGPDFMRFYATKQKFIETRATAFRGTVNDLQGRVGVPFTLTEMGNSSDQAWAEQWQCEGADVRRESPNGGWDWPQIRQNAGNNPNRFHVAIWSETRLCALAMGRLTKAAHCLEIAEGNPRLDCPLKGKRLTILLDCAARYAQGTGRNELRLIDPANEKLIELYTSRFKFTLVTPRGEKPYCVREV